MPSANAMHPKLLQPPFTKLESTTLKFENASPLITLAEKFWREDSQGMVQKDFAEEFTEDFTG